MSAGMCNSIYVAKQNIRIKYVCVLSAVCVLGEGLYLFISTRIFVWCIPVESSEQLSLPERSTKQNQIQANHFTSCKIPFNSLFLKSIRFTYTKSPKFTSFKITLLHFLPKHFRLFLLNHFSFSLAKSLHHFLHYRQNSLLFLSCKISFSSLTL